MFHSRSNAIFLLSVLPIIAAVSSVPASRHAAAGAPEGRSWFVDARATSGRADGSEAHPFPTIQQAAEAAGPGDIVFVKAGTYRETVTPRRSGEPGRPITFRPYKNDTVTISGTDPITGWSREGNAYRAAMPGDFYRSAIHYSDQVFVGGRMMVLARWPNTTLDLSHPTKAMTTRFVAKSRDTDNWTTATVEDDRLPDAPAGFYEGAEIVVQPNENAWSWTLSGTVTAVAGKRITLRSRSDSGKDGEGNRYHDHSRYYLQNKRTLLDTPGEWFHDREAGTLYLIPPDGVDPNQRDVEARRRDYGFDLDDRSYITIQGFHLFACTITTDEGAGKGLEWDDRGNDLFPWRGGKTLAAAHHILLDGLTVLYPSHFTDQSGHFFLQWGQNTGLIVSGSDCTVRNCRIRWSAGNGITLLGRRQRALNNRIEDVSYNQFDNAGIATGGAADAFDFEIGYNTIRRCGRSGILPRNLRNADPTRLVTRIHHNDISECMLQDFDGGCIYGGGDGTFVRIDHNWCHDVSGFAASGIYPDGLSNWLIDHNVVWNVEWGIHLQNNGRPEANAICYNNTLIVKNTSKTPYGPFGFGNNANHGKGNVIRNNIIVCLNPAESPGYRPISGSFEESETTDNFYGDLTPGSPTDPRFISIANRDFRLAPGSPAIDKGKQIPTYRRDGYSVQAFMEDIVGAAPDLGACESGAKPWKAGCTLPPFSP